MAPLEWGLALAVALLATAVQSVTGMGFGLVAVPLLALVAPSLEIVAVLALTLLVMVLVTLLERRWLCRHDLAIASLAAVPGVAAGTIVAALAPRTATLVTVGLIVVVSSAAALSRWRPPVNRSTLLVAGSLGGLLTPVAALPGPPMAIGYRPPDVRRMRSTMSAFFAVTATMSLVSLSWLAIDAGDLRALLRQALAGLALAPAVVVGAILARRIVGRVSARVVRTSALLLSLLSGAVLSLRALFG